MPTKLAVRKDAGCSTERGNRRPPTQMWDNYCYFIKAVLPVAEAAGVKMALHPDDPPVPMLGGVARIFNEPAGLQASYAALPEEPRLGP